MSHDLPTGLSSAYWREWRGSRNADISNALEPGETWIGGWEGIGLYEANNKIPQYQSTTVHITTHRLIVIPDSDTPYSSPASSSKALPLQSHMSNVRQTELYAGFMRSSPKITLSLGPAIASSSQHAPASNATTSSPEVGDEDSSETSSSWTCGVCGFVNPVQGFGIPGPSTKCSLCGVSYTPARTTSLPVPSSGTATPVITSMSSPGTPQPKPPDPEVGDTDGRIACPACTFLNHPSLRNCEICSTPLPRKSAVPSRVQNGSRPGIPPITLPVNTSSGGMDIVRLSFRKGGVQEAYRRLKNVLSDKVWERERSLSSTTQNHSRADSGSLASPSTSRAVAGIDGIMQSINLESKSQDGHMQDAFKDLEVLMVRAGEMVKMAQSLNAKLTAQQSSSTSAPVAEEDATLIRSSLVQLGLSAPALTQDMIKDQKKYQLGLAQELGRLLTGSPGSAAGGLMSSKGRGVIALDEVWGLWMRARGIALLPPSTLVAILPLIPECTSPSIKTLSLPSSMKVLYTPVYEPINLLSRLVDYLVPIGDRDLSELRSFELNTGEILGVEPSLSLIEIASREDLPIGLAKELLDLIEMLPPPAGHDQVFGIVRDDQADQASGGTRCYRDIISSWQI